MRGDILPRAVPLHVQVAVLTTFTILYLVVALWVKAMVMFSVLVCTVYVSTVLAAREPANRDRGEKKKDTMKQCPGSSVHKPGTNEVNSAFISLIYGPKSHFLYPLQRWSLSCPPFLIYHYLKVFLEQDHSDPVHS